MPGGNVKLLVRSLLFLLTVFLVAASAQDPLTKLRDETVSYFKPVKGKITARRDSEVVSDLGQRSGIKSGMRLTVLREGTPFLHPITKEPLGKVETAVGTALVRDVEPDSSTLTILEGNAAEGDIVRISESKMRVLFFQDRNVDWGLGEHYYQLLKESGRFELIDTSLDRGDDQEIVAEAKRKDAQVALVLRSVDAGAETVLRQRLFWVNDIAKFTESEVRLDSALIKELHLGEGMVAPLSSAGDALLVFDLPFKGKLIAMGDVHGDGKQEVIIASGKNVQIFAPGTSLLNLHEIKGNASDDLIWLDCFDINGDGKDEIIVTSMRDGEIISSVYGLKGSEFSLFWKDSLFLRMLNNTLIAQRYEKGVGFQGPVFAIVYENGEFRKGDVMKLPRGVNIYDFSFMNGLDGAQYILAYDESGFLNLFNKEGLRLWVSKEDSGGFETTFKKTAPTIMVERGVWSVKDRLLSRNKETFMVKRIPLAQMARGLGNKRSQIKTLFWTGLSMEERVLIDGISGSVIDYALSGDRLIVMSKPLFGIKGDKILKGENPLGSMLYIYSLKGR